MRLSSSAVRWARGRLGDLAMVSRRYTGRVGFWPGGRADFWAGERADLGIESAAVDVPRLRRPDHGAEVWFPTPAPVVPQLDPLAREIAGLLGVRAGRGVVEGAIVDKRRATGA